MCQEPLLDGQQRSCAAQGSRFALNGLDTANGLTAEQSVVERCDGAIRQQLFQRDIQLQFAS